MADGRLFIGTKRYSSWSLRGWLAVRLAKLDVEEIVIALAGGSTPAIKATTPSGMVPYLEHGPVKIWESLAICEYCAELAPQLWPADLVARSHARAIASEMHGGFRELRMAMPMSLFRPGSGLGHTEAALADVRRIDAIWTETRARFGAGGPYLFGAAFTNADAMYAPIVARLLTYRPPISEIAEQYCAAVRAHPLMVDWYDAAADEPAEWHIERFETGA